MAQRYKAGSFSKGVAWWSVLLILLAVAGGVALFYFNREGNAVAVWYCCVVVSLFLLALIASPSSAVVGEQGVEIRCVLRSEYLSLRDIRSVRLVEWSSLGRVVPMGGVFGFLGYYGRFYSSALHSRVDIFARSRNSLVEVRTKCRCYILSLSEPEEFIDAVDSLRSEAKHFENQTK